MRHFHASKISDLVFVPLILWCVSNVTVVLETLDSVFRYSDCVPALSLSQTHSPQLCVPNDYSSGLSQSHLSSFCSSLTCFGLSSTLKRSNDALFISALILKRKIIGPMHEAFGDVVTLVL